MLLLHTFARAASDSHVHQVITSVSGRESPGITSVSGRQSPGITSVSGRARTAAAAERGHLPRAAAAATAAVISGRDAA